MPIHYDDYTVFRSPIEDFRREPASARLATTIHYLYRGETFRFRPEDLRS